MKTKKILLSNATNSKLPDDQLSRLFVGNLNTSQISKKHVLKLFGKFGQIRAISMHRGYAFVQFFQKEHASSAIRKMHGQLVGGQVIDVNLVTEPKPYQKKLTFSEHRSAKPIEYRTDHLASSKKPSEPIREATVREPAVREADSSRESLNSFKKETSGSYSSKRVSHSASQPHPHLHPTGESSHSPYSASQNLITSSTTERSSFASSRPAYLNSTNQTKKAVRPPVRQPPQQTTKLPYIASFESLMSSIYQQHARSSQSSQLNGSQLNQSAYYQPGVYLQTYGQPSGYDLIVCGSCKRVFYNFSIFLQHKQAMCPLTSTADLCITNSR